MYSNCDQCIKIWWDRAVSFRSPTDGPTAHILRPNKASIELHVCLTYCMQWRVIFYSQSLLGYLCYKDIVVFHSVHRSQGFSLGSVCWAPIIRLIGRLWRDLIGRSVSVKCVVYTWTEDSLINCTVKRFVRVHSTRTEDTKTASGRALNRMWPEHRHIQYRK